MWSFRLTFVISVISICTSVPVANEDEYIVRLNILGGEPGSGDRAKRAADFKLPDQLSFGFPVDGSDVVLTLSKKPLLPTVTADAVSAAAANRVPENSGVYTDQSRGSVVIVQMKAGDYKLEGSFLHGHKEWNLKPLNRNRRDIDKNEASLHRVFPAVAKNIAASFVGDAVQDPIERPELMYTLGRRHHGYKGRELGEHPNLESHVRRARQAVRPVNHTIEIGFIVDYSDFLKWERYVGENAAPARMRLWYTYIAESINVRYETIIDPDISIRTTVTVLKILTTAASAAFFSRLANSAGEINGTEGLNAVLNWYPSQSDIPLSDHYMFFTGYDIRGASGIAFSSRVCTASGVSICENSFTGIVGGVCAHELGHSLSAVHDANTGGSCTDNDQFVMSTIFRTPVRSDKEGNPWRFSSCSVDSFKTYLSSVTCTLPENTSGGTVLPAQVEGQRAGEVLSRDEQCRLSFRDSQSFFCEQVQEMNGGIESLCGGMYCAIPNNTQGYCQTTIPQEFTECGVDKWCVTGRCVNVTSDTAAADSNSTIAGNNSTASSDTTTSSSDTTTSSSDTTTSSSDTTTASSDTTTSSSDTTTSSSDTTTASSDTTASSSDTTTSSSDTTTSSSDTTTASSDTTTSSSDTTTASSDTTTSLPVLSESSDTTARAQTTTEPSSTRAETSESKTTEDSSTTTELTQSPTISSTSSTVSPARDTTADAATAISSSGETTSTPTSSTDSETTSTSATRSSDTTKDELQTSASTTTNPPTAAQGDLDGAGNGPKSVPTAKPVATRTTCKPSQRRAQFQFRNSRNRGRWGPKQKRRYFY